MHEPRISICQLTTPHATLAEDLEAFAAAGATGIGLTEEKLGGDDTEARDLVRSSGLIVTHCVPRVGSILPGPLLPGPVDPTSRAVALAASVERFAAFDPVACTCLTGPAGDLGAADARRHVVRELRRVAQVAEEHGIMLAVEPVNHEFAGDWSIVDDIPSGVDLIDEVGSDSLGLLVDVWHLWDSPTFADDIERHATRIVGFHVADRRSPTRTLWDRALPGDGIADLGAKLEAIESAGRSWWLDLEVMSDDGRYGSPFPDSLWHLPSAELARRAVDSLARMLAPRVVSP